MYRLYTKSVCDCVLPHSVIVDCTVLFAFTDRLYNDVNVYTCMSVSAAYSI